MEIEKGKANKVRIILNEKSKTTLDSWKNSLEKSFPGINVSHQQLVAWVVEKTGADLSKKDQALIRNQFFDEVKQLEWLLEKAKSAKTNGEAIHIADLLKSEAKSKTKRSVDLDSEVCEENT